MEVYREPRLLSAKVKKIKKQGKGVGFVPTMGYLHEGHLSLTRKAKKDTDYVVVSIFVNPIQFGAGEDLKKYPRDLRRDLSLCRNNGVDAVFVPASKTMYKPGFSTYVNVEGLTDGLCGASRPGHFKGVTTVVAKLLNIVNPDTAYFGQKDAQQAIVIKQMAADLDMPIKIKIMPIIREKDGLAMSSRNVYLSPLERKEALSLYRSLRTVKGLWKRGEKNTEKLARKMRDVILKEKHAEIDYVSIVDMKALKPIKRISGKALAAVAAKIGKTRLIDNIILG
ncbi:MAG: pantoate--beta-alanine ligase [Candidatus Omnitrophica bacterium]|nr:pantoate--beta-alanine ligase [Candidatus Omnitrophota bacterium]